MRLLIGLLALFALAYGELDQRSSWVESQVEELIQKVDPTALVGIKVISMDNHTTLYERNAPCRFVPGSTVKLLTAEAALQELGEEFRFHTTIRATCPLAQGVLKGDCYFVGSGDPSFSAADLFEMVDQLKLHAIEGDLIKSVYLTIPI